MLFLAFVLYKGGMKSVDFTGCFAGSRRQLPRRTKSSYDIAYQQNDNHPYLEGCDRIRAEVVVPEQFSIKTRNFIVATEKKFYLGHDRFVFVKN